MFFLNWFTIIAQINNTKIAKTDFSFLKRWVRNTNRISAMNNAGRNQSTFIPYIPNTYHSWMRSVLGGTTLETKSEYSTMKIYIRLNQKYGTMIERNLFSENSLKFFSFSFLMQMSIPEIMKKSGI